jgi:flagellar basal-body rod protein FlgF
MDRLLYTAMNGAQQSFVRQRVNANNLANASTAGFRQDLANFASRDVVGPGLESRTHSLALVEGMDVSHGPVNATGRTLDVAVNGDGWLVVQAPNGEEAFTRAGDLRVNSAGVLTTAAGHPVIGEGGPIALPQFEELNFAKDGTLSIRPVGEPATNILAVDRLKLVNPDPSTLVKGGDGLVRLRDGGAGVADAAVQVTPGAREGSNVNTVDALVDMIELSRSYEMNINMMKVARENDASDNRLLQLPQ